MDILVLFVNSCPLVSDFIHPLKTAPAQEKDNKKGLVIKHQPHRLVLVLDRIAKVLCYIFFLKKRKLQELLRICMAWCQTWALELEKSELIPCVTVQVCTSFRVLWNSLSWLRTGYINVRLLYLQLLFTRLYCWELHRLLKKLYSPKVLDARDQP